MRRDAASKWQERESGGGVKQLGQALGPLARTEWGTGSAWHSGRRGGASGLASPKWGSPVPHGRVVTESTRETSSLLLIKVPKPRPSLPHSNQEWQLCSKPGFSLVLGWSMLSRSEGMVHANTCQH